MIVKNTFQLVNYEVIREFAMAMQRTELLVGPDESFRNPGLQVVRGLFSNPSFLRSLHQEILDQPGQRVIHDLTDPQTEISDALASSAEIARQFAPVNTLVTKYYQPGVDNRAYVTHGYHRHPEQYRGHAAVILTIGGQAITNVILPTSEDVDVYANPDTAMVIDDVLHATSPPLDNQPRTIVFAGVDNTRPELP